MATTRSVLLLLALVALAGLVDLQAVAAAPTTVRAAEVSLTTGMADPELDGTMQCVIGCFTKVLGCAFKCLRVRKGIDLPLCVIGCNDRGIVCMFSCGRTPPRQVRCETFFMAQSTITADVQLLLVFDDTIYIARTLSQLPCEWDV
ncbi:hypothetical protein ZWY2020_011680 [Hordeum vulgare]|nr:hypothetical protein ZWY2020_011680 [Hordeum vulgare]